MKMKDLSSVKTASINARPSPMGTHQSLPRHQRNSSQFFPHDILNDEGDSLNEMTSTPQTPSPPPRTALPPVPQTENKDRAATPTARPNPITPDPEEEMPPVERTTECTHPNVVGDDEEMLDQAPPLTTTTTTPNAHQPANTTPPSEEELLRAHLAVAEINRSIIKSNGINSLTVIPQFTPIPMNGFPRIHLAHTVQLFDFQGAKTITAWLKVLNPKVLIRVFDHDRKNPSIKGPILVEHLQKAISNIAKAVLQDDQEVKVSLPCPETIKEETDHPLSFLAYNISEEMKNLILDQRIWSSTEITFVAHPFQINAPPLLLFCLQGFSTMDINTVRAVVHDMWVEDVTMWDITDILFESEIPDKQIHSTVWDFVNSLWVERLDFKVSGGILLPHYNIFAVSPMNKPAVWTKLRAYLHSLTYPSELEGSGTSVNSIPCPLCHSIAHPHGLCPFPNVPLWNGPKHNVNPKPSNGNQRGRGRGRRTFAG
ncbi:hypothetical protein F4604DRAFT_1677773 [Suillus subluteus]|nr:hypothetical protein F4604DRAFT_1677773 [Suillus subluteus]